MREKKDAIAMKPYTRLCVALLLLGLLCLCGCGSNPIREAAGEAPTAPADSPAVEAMAESADPRGTPEPTPAPAPADTPAVDTAALDAARDALLEDFRIIRITEPGEFRQESYPEIPAYSITAYLLYRFDGVQLFWGYYDFDGSGVPELVMATGENEISAEPIGIYAFDGESLHYLGKDMPLGERCHLSFGDGVFTVTGSGGASSGEVLRYRIAPDGYSTEVLSRFAYEYDEQGQVTLTDIVGHTEPAAFEHDDFFQPFDVPIDFHAVD